MEMLRVAREALKSSLRAASSKAELGDALKARIGGIVKADPVVVFMKGTQKEPQCGFSRNVKLVLDYHEVPFRDYNVLEDAELREGVKAYSEWPTIPQVYVNGTFVGGSDILVQMHKEGEISDFFDKQGIASKFGEKKSGKS